MFGDLDMSHGDDCKLYFLLVSINKEDNILRNIDCSVTIRIISLYLSPTVYLEKVTWHLSIYFIKNKNHLIRPELPTLCDQTGKKDLSQKEAQAQIFIQSTNHTYFITLCTPFAQVIALHTTHATTCLELVLISNITRNQETHLNLEYNIKCYIHTIGRRCN